VFSWQDTLQQHDKLTSCSKKQDLSQGHWKKTMQISLLEPLLQARTGVCADNWMNKYVTSLRSASSQSWIGKCPTTVLQLQHLSKIVQAELVTKKDVGHAAMPSAVRLKL